MSEFVNPLRTIWKHGRCAVNGWIAAPSVISAEAMSKAGWDTVTVDMQHGTADYGDLLSIFPVIERWGSVPLVRVPWNEPVVVKRVLDAGATTVLFPFVQNAAEAAAAVAATRYPPDGIRGMAFVGMYRGPYFGVMELQARWAAGVLSGRLPAPDRAAMDRAMALPAPKACRAKVPASPFRIA